VISELWDTYFLDFGTLGNTDFRDCGAIVGPKMGPLWGHFQDFAYSGTKCGAIVGHSVGPLWGHCGTDCGTYWVVWGSVGDF
jgi:hypothetical protein